MQFTIQKSLTRFFNMMFFSMAFFAQAQTPFLLKDINTSTVNSSPRGMVNVNGTVFFSADDGAHGRELWKSGGTEATTVLVKDINPAGSSNPANFCNVNGTVFFTATTPENGTELWKTDGTDLGTVLVADINVGAIGSEPSKLTACGNFLYFVAKRRTGVLEELKLYNSNGTAAGTKVKDITDTPITNPENLVSDGTSLFFSGFSASTGVELCRTWGENGDLMFIHINQQGSASSFPRNLTMIGMALFFSADNGPHGRQIHQYIPGANLLFPVTLVVSQNVPGIQVQEMVNIGTKIFLSASSGLPNTGSELFVMGTNGNPQKINGVANVSNLTVVGDTLFFVQSPPGAAPKLNSVSSTGDDLTTPKTFDLMPNGEFPGPRNLMNVGGKLFFTAARENEGRELWKASKFSATRIQDFVAGPTGANITDMCVRSLDVFFACNGPDGNELRKSNGNGIVTVRNIGQAGSFPKEFVKMGAFTYFAANDGIKGRELWKTNGDVGNATLVADIITGPTGSNPTDLIVVTTAAGVQTLFFVAQSPSNGRELFKLENTGNAVPSRISDILVGGGNAGIGNMTDVNGTLHFTATQGLPALGDRIFKVNAARTGVVATGGAMVFANNLKAMGNTLFFTQSPQGAKLLSKIVNGNSSLVKSFQVSAGFADPIPQELTVIGSRLFFTAGDGAQSRRVWVTNASATSASFVSTHAASNLTNFNGRLVFTAPKPNFVGLTSIFRVNTSLNGADTIADGSAISTLRAAGTNLYFLEFLSHGRVQLSKITAFNNNPLPLREFLEGNTGAVNEMIAVGGNLYFTMNESGLGNELWKANGTSNAITLVSDIHPGVGNSNVHALRLCGTDLFFSANNLTNGQEPWKLANAAAVQGDDSEERAEEVAENTVFAPVAAEIKVYPNPATDFVSVDISENEMGGTLNLLSSSGQLVRNASIMEGETSIRLELQGLPKGIYLVRWEQKDGVVVTKKVVLQ
jgi:ELWxxDGT repeat protein